MKDRVVVQDDTYRENVVTVVTPWMAHNNPHLKVGSILRTLDGNRNQVQNTLTVEHVFEGRCLELAMRRAKRFIRAKRNGKVGTAPKHIALKMAAFSLADPDGFRDAMTEAVV